MSTRATRLLKLLDALRQRRQPVSGVQLAETFGVSLRTLYRDIDTLRGQGADIAGDPGIGYQLRPGFLLPPMMFSEEELEAMVLGTRWVASHADPELAMAARGAMDRILGILPEGLRLQVETGGLFAPDWCPSAPEPWLPTLRRAIRGQRALHLAYADAGNRVSQRTIWPFAMAFLDDRRLLAAWCELRGEFRHFRADRVLGLEDAGRGYPEARHSLLRRWRVQEQLRQRERTTADRN